MSQWVKNVGSRRGSTDGHWQWWELWKSRKSNTEKEKKVKFQTKIQREESLFSKKHLLILSRLVSSSSSSDITDVTVEKTPPHDSIDDQTCTICLEEFQTSGEHRTSCLKWDYGALRHEQICLFKILLLFYFRCGHVFGESCIRRWLSSDQKICPECRTKASVRDIRLIYLRHARVVDNSKEIELELQLQTLKDERAFFVMNEVQHKSEIARLKAEIDNLKKAAITSTTCVGIRAIKDCRIYQERCCDFKEDLQSKHMRYIPTTRKILVSQKAATGSLFPGYGIKVVDLNTFRSEKFINASSNKEICDFNIDLTRSFVVTASRELIAKIYNVKSSENVVTMRHTKPFWSCTFDSAREGIVFLGDQSGSVLKYDVRNPSEIVNEYKTVQLSASPVKFIVTMKANDTFPHGGLFIVYIKGLVFYDDINHTSTVLSSDSIATLTYEEKTEMLLVTKCPTKTDYGFTPTRHYLIKLLKDNDGFPYMEEIISYNGTISPVPKFSRPAQIKVSDGVLLASYNEDSKTIQVRSHSDNKIFHELSILDRISDICPLEGQLLGALSDSKLRLYKMNINY